MQKTTTEQEILTVLRAEWAAFFRRDFDALAAHWVHGPEVRRTLSGPHCRTIVTVGWERLESRLREGMRLFSQAVDAEEWLRWDNIQVVAGSDMAWVCYDQVATRRNDLIQSSVMQHETKILHRIDGAWKLVCLFIVVPGIGRDDTPMIELGPDGKVFRVNALARDRLADHPGIVVSGGHVRARNRSFDQPLQAEIARALNRMRATPSPGFSLRRPVDVVALGKDELDRPLHCWITIEQERILVSFDDSYQVEQKLDLAAELFAFSPAQRLLAGHLAAGDELSAAASELGVSVNTVRTQLRRMFEKSGTHNQAALVSALLSVQRPA